MIVYGDHDEHIRPADRLASINADLLAIATMPAGIDRHAALVGALIALGQIVQGVADAHFATTGADGGSSVAATLATALRKIAHAVIASWDSGFAQMPSLGEVTIPADLPDQITVRRPEGYSFYAVYPEAYALAARKLALRGKARVIGIRSIGTGLAEIVAAVLHAPPVVTVRPTGHAFARTIRLAPEVAQDLLDGDSHYVIVDEGPGLSGSSFAAVADTLEAAGVPPHRIAFLPSHGGSPGIKACERTRTRWAQANRPVVTLDELVPPERLAEWVSPLVGPLDDLPQDISGGAWRALKFGDERDWPAIDPYLERRKFIACAGGERWLIKFAGLGHEGKRKLERARMLHAAGLTPEVRGLVHGLLVERWVAAEPFDPRSPDAIDIAARYLGARARLLPVPENAGATLAELFEMAQFNIRTGIGASAAERLAELYGRTEGLEARAIRVATDNRCDPHKWLRLRDGSVVKADALDHDSAHDLIGAQDLAWDIAGVAAEFALDEDGIARLVTRVDDAAPRPVDRALLSFLAPCYLAFRFGAARLTEASLADWPAEAARNRAAGDRYADRLIRIMS